MQSITTIGLDIAKSVFQVHGVDAAGQVVIRRQLNSLCPGVLPEANAMSGRYGSLRLVAPLVTRAPGTGSDAEFEKYFQLRRAQIQHLWSDRSRGFLTNTAIYNGVRKEVRQAHSSPQWGQ